MVNRAKNKITQYLIPTVNINQIIISNVEQYFIPQIFYNDICLNGSAFTGDNLKFYDNKLLKEMDNLTLRQLAGNM